MSLRKRQEDRTIFNLFGNKGKRKTMMEAVQEAAQNPAVFLIDVRTQQEYVMGHVPGAKNIPVDQLSRVPQLVKDQEAPVYLYCASGSRSMMAAMTLKRMGYQNAVNVGGLHSFSGKLER